MQPMLRPNGERARYAMYSFYALAVIIAVQAFLIFQLYQAQDDGRMLNLLQTIQTTGTISIILHIINIILFLQWFRRAYFNLHQIPGTRLSFDEGWAAGAWFVPFLNLVRPYQIGKEVYEQTKEQARSQDGNNALPGLWWASYIIKIVMGIVASTKLRNVEDIDDLKSGLLLLLISLIVDLLALFTAIKFVRDTARHEAQLQNGLLIDEIGENREEENPYDGQW